MLRLLMLGVLVLFVAMGLRGGWIEIHWDRMATELGLPFLAQPAPQNLFDSPKKSR